jgi:hypothetical protein
LEIDRGRPEMGMPELTLDHDGRPRGPSRSRVRAGADGARTGAVLTLPQRSAQLAACRRRLPVAPGGRAVDHAEQWPGRKPDAELLPGLQLPPCPRRLCRDGPARTRGGRPGRSRRARALSDPQPGSPEHDD